MTFAEVANYLLEMHWKNITNAIKNQLKDEFTIDPHKLTEEEIGELISWKDESPFAELMNLCTKYKNIILDCWEWLKPKPQLSPLSNYPRLHDREMLENQEELINALRKILEPVVDEILKVEDEE